MYRLHDGPRVSSRLSKDAISREPAWMLGFRAKRTDLHKKYAYP